MRWFIAINCPDEALFDQNGAIKSCASDRRLRVDVRPRWSLWKDALFDTSIRSSSNDRDLIGGPSVASNLNRYNSGDGRLRLNRQSFA